MTPDRILCPRCGESLPPTLDVCDACGADLATHPGAQSASSAGAPQSGALARGSRAAGAGKGRSSAGARGAAQARGESQGVPGIAWLLLVVGLAVGGMVGYALHSAVGPRAESGMPAGPADIMAGASGEAGGAAGDMGGSAPQRMPPQVVQLVQSYKAALAKNPKDLEANTGLGNLEFDSGQWQKAIDYYSRALEIDPGNADVRVDRAVAYHATGQNDTAKKELLRVTREKPTHKNAWLNLGVVNRELGDRAGALRAWEEYLKLDPNGEHSAGIRQEIEGLKQTG